MPSFRSRPGAMCLSLVLCGAALLLAAGCRYPSATPTYEYVTAYDRMSDKYEPLVSLVYVPEPTALSAYRGIIIGDIGVGEQWVESPGEAERYATFFRVLLRRKLLDLDKFEFVSLDPPEPGSPALSDDVMLLEAKITRFNMGCGFLRYFSYFFWGLGMGATDLQIEGRLTEASSGDLVLEFVDRRRAHCNTDYGPNPRNFSSGYGMNFTATQTAGCLAQFVEECYEGLPAVQAACPADDIPANTNNL